MYVPICTLETKQNLKLTNLIRKGFKRSVFWNKYKSKIETHELETHQLDSSFQGVNKLFLLAYDNTENGNNRVERNSHRKYFLPGINITKSNVLIDGRNFYDQPINDQIRKYDELRKIATGKGGDYTTGFLLDYKYFKDHYQLFAGGLSKQKELAADPRALQQIECNFMLDTNSQILTIMEKSKEIILELYEGTAKVL